MLQDGWLQKESRWWRNWRWRYVALSVDGQLKTFTREPDTRQETPHSRPRRNSSSRSFLGESCSALHSRNVEEEGPPCEMTDCLDLSAARCWAGQAPGVMGRRAIVPFQLAVAVDTRIIWFAAGSAELRDAWVAAMRRAALGAHSTSSDFLLHGPRSHSQPPARWSRSFEVGPRVSMSIQMPFLCDNQLPGLLGQGRRASFHALPDAKGQVGDVDADKPQVVQNDSPVETTCKGKGKGKAVGPPLPSGQGKGKGKGPPLPTGFGKGKGGGKGPPPPSTKKSPASRQASKSSTVAETLLPLRRRTALKVARMAPVILHGLSRERDDDESVASCDGDDSKSARRVTSFDVEALHQAFEKLEAPPPRKSLARALRIELLSRDTAQNIAIVFAKLRVDTEKLAEALTALNATACMLSSEEATRLLHVWPSPEELTSLVVYVQNDGDLKILRDVERQLAPLVGVPRMGPRLRLVTLAGTLDTRVDEAVQKLTKLQAMSVQIQSATILPHLLAIVVEVFNYTHYGTQVGEESHPDMQNYLRGVDVFSILRLHETKATKKAFSNFNLLHFALDQLLQQRPGLRQQDLQEELSLLPEVAGTNLELLRQELSQLRGEHAFVRGELDNHSHAYQDAESSTGSAPSTSDSEDSEDEVLTETDAQKPVAEEDPPAQLDVLRPPEDQRRGVFKELLCRGLDLASFADDWRHGNAVVGESALPPMSARGFDLSVDEGLSLPSGWLWLYRPSGWHRCWCEFRAYALVARMVQHERVVSTFYIVMPHAEVLAIDAPGASEGARHLAASGAAPYGFEIRNASSLQDVILSCEYQHETDEWVRAVELRAAAPGSGYLQAHSAGRPFLGGTRRRFFCHIHRGRLLGFVRPREGVMGSPPGRIWPLHGTGVRKLCHPSATTASRALSHSEPCGFELEHFQTNQAWQFVCDSIDEEQRWMKAVGQAGALLEAGEEANREAPTSTASLSLDDNLTSRWGREGGRSSTSSPKNIYESMLQTPLHVTDGAEGGDYEVHRTQMLTELHMLLSTSLELTHQRPSGADPERPDVPSATRSRFDSAGSDGGSLAPPPPPSPRRAQRSSLESGEVVPSLGSRWPAIQLSSMPQSDGSTGGDLPSSVLRSFRGGEDPTTTPTDIEDTQPMPNRVVRAFRSSVPGGDGNTLVTPRNVDRRTPETVDPRTPRIVAKWDEEREKSSEAPVKGSVVEDDAVESTEPSLKSPSHGSLARLMSLDIKLGNEIIRWSDALEAAEDECRRLLIFFGLEGPGPRLSGVVMPLLGALALFERQLRTSWEELDRHRSGRGNSFTT